MGYKDPDLDTAIDDDGDLIDFNSDDDKEQEVNRTQPFQLGAASTSYHGGEQHEMQTRQHEQSGLPSYEETSFSGAQNQIKKLWDALTRLFPRASATDLDASQSKTSRLQVKIAGFAKKVYPLFTKDKNKGQERLNPALSKEIKRSLGSSAEEIIAEDRDTIKEQRQRLEEAETQQRLAEALAAEREAQQAQEIQNLGQQFERTQVRIDAIQEEHGTNLESEAELNRLKLLKKNYKDDLEKKKKEKRINRP